MKRIIVLLSLLLFALSSVSYAWGGGEVITWKTYTLENSTGAYVGYSIPTTTITPGMAVLGYAIIPLGKSSESVVGLYDGTGAGYIVSDELFDEAEADGTNSLPHWFPHPRKILTSLLVQVGPNTRVIIYFD